MTKSTEPVIDIDAPIQLDHTTFVDYAFEHWLDSLKAGTKPKTLCLLGPPGIGKSSTAYAIQEKMTSYVREHPEIIFGVKTVEEAIVLLEEARAQEVKDKFYAEVVAGKLAVDDYEQRIEFVISHFKPLTKEDVGAFAEILDFSSKLPEDLGGLPFRSADGFTDYCPQRWVAKLCKRFAFGVYVQDDLPAAPKAMQVAGRQSALERRIHENCFANGVLVLVTGNRRQDKSAASALPAHFLNSVTLMTIALTLEEWKKWYGRQKGLDPVVTAFLSWKPGLLSELPTDATDKLGAFATPRQWASLGAQYVTAEKDSTVLLAVASGLIGKANALTFCSFVEIRSKLVPPEQVLDDPRGALPDPEKMLDEPSKRCAMAMALGDHAAHRWTKGTGKRRDETPVKLFEALAHCSAAGDEYSAVGVQSFLDNGGDLTALARVARRAKTDPVIGRLLDHVKHAMLGV